MDPSLLRKTNIRNTGGGQHLHYDSMYKTDYLEFPHESAELNAENLKDLRQHHFKLGFDQPNPDNVKSENHAEYIKKSINPDEKADMLKTKKLA